MASLLRFFIQVFYKVTTMFHLSLSRLLLNCWCLVTRFCLTLCNSMDCSTPGLSVPYHLLQFVQIHVHCVGDAIQPSHPLRPSSPSAFNLSQHQRLFQSAVHIRWPKYRRFSFSISSSNDYSGLITRKTDWFDLLAVQGTLRNLLQHHNSKASVLWHSAFFTVWLSQH